jgi:hypothetical protein
MPLTSFIQNRRRPSKPLENVFPSLQFTGKLFSDNSYYQATAWYILGNYIKNPPGLGKETTKTCSCRYPSRQPAGSVDYIGYRYLFLPQVP